MMKDIIDPDGNYTRLIVKKFSRLGVAKTHSGGRG